MSATAQIETLTTVLQHAERERDAAQAMLQQAEAGLRAAIDQAEQLARYGQDYAARWGARPGLSGHATQLQTVHGFMQRLDQARVQQARQCELADQRRARARAELQARELRVAALQKLIERRLGAQRTLDDRRAQRQTDEAAQRAHRLRPSAFAHL